jgi:hypothetical protein
MAIWLQIILGIVLLAVCACLVPLLLQLRRTATSVQQLAESAREDLRQIAADVHHLRGRADVLADMAAAGMEMPMSIGRIVNSTVLTVESLLTKVGPPWLEVMLTGLKFVLNLVRRPKPAEPTKAASHE